MAGYIPHYQKKQEILAAKEEKLRRLLAQQAAEPLLLKAAEVVRDARIIALRAKQAQLSPQDTPQRTKTLANLAAKIDAMKNTTPETILIEFR